MNENDVRVFPMDVLELNKHGSAMQKVLHLFGKVINRFRNIILYRIIVFLLVGFSLGGILFVWCFSICMFEVRCGCKCD